MKTTSSRRTCWLSLASVFWVAALSSHADVLEHWTTNQVSTNSFTLQYVTHGDGRYVAYGLYSDYGVVMSSEDGLNWIKRLDGGSNSGFSYSIALSYAGGRFFAFGGFGVSATSGDGINWTTFPFNRALGAAYGNGIYCAVMNDNFAFPTAVYDVFTSPNGLTWTPHNVNASIGDIAYGAGLFVGIGINNGIRNDAGHTYTSSGGSVWTPRNIPGGSKISFGNGRFIVPYLPGTNLVSADGINWASVSTGITNLLGKVSYANGMFFALAGSYLATSADGTNWWRYAQPAPGDGYSVATDGTRLVTVGGAYVGDLHYNAYAYRSDLLIGLRLNDAPRQVVLSGLVGRSYQIESADVLTNSGTTNWQARFTGQLLSTPFSWSDPTATNSTQRYYRAVLLP